MSGQREQTLFVGRNNYCVFFNFDFDATSTGVDSINAQDSEENADDKVYDLQGRRVANPVKGIYIVNGKKVLMK